MAFIDYSKDMCVGGGVQFIVNTIKNKSIHKFGHKIVGFYFLESIKNSSPSRYTDKSRQKFDRIFFSHSK